MASSLPFPDPGPGRYNPKKEAHMRDMITMHASYSESGPTFDPEGTYLCGACNMRVLPDRCTVVGDVPISMTTGGCRRWHKGAPTGEELPKKSTPDAVEYGEREGGFGCVRCEYGVKAAVPDGARTTWCGFWGLRVKPNACCEENDGNGLTEPYLVQITTGSSN